MKPTVLLLAAVLVSRAALAQATVPDDGSISISRAGTRVGREDFSIRHVPTTAGAFETLTRGIVVTGAHRITVDYNADSVGLPARFVSKASDDGRAGDSYRVEVLGHRYSARTVRATASPMPASSARAMASSRCFWTSGLNERTVSWSFTSAFGSTIERRR